MPRPDEGMIHAWIDGELSPEEAERVEKLVESDPEWSAAAAEARGLIAASSRILGELDSVPAGVIPRGSSASPAGRGAAIRSNRWVRMAAGLVLVAGTAWGIKATVSSDTDIIAKSSELVVTGDMSESVSAAVAAPSPSPAAASASVSEAAQVPPAVAAPAVVADAEIARARELRSEIEPSPTTGVTGAATGEVARGELARSEAASIELARSEAAKSQVARGDVVAGGAMSGRAARGAAAPMAMQAFNAVDGLGVLEGCWQMTTAGGADSVLVAPQLMSERGDTVTIVVDATGRTATAVRADSVLRGVLTPTETETAPWAGRFEARRVRCDGDAPGSR